AAADWKGKTPAGISATFRCSTRHGCIFPRVFQSDEPEDKKAVQDVLQEINTYPLSKFDGKVKITNWSKLPQYPGAKGAAEVKWVEPEKFVDVLPAVLNEVPPLPGEEAMHGQFHAVLEAVAKDAKLKAAFTTAAAEAEKEIVTPLFQFRNFGLPLPGN